MCFAVLGMDLLETHDTVLLENEGGIYSQNKKTAKKVEVGRDRSGS